MQRQTETKPIPPTTPTRPETLAHAAHQPANTAIHPVDAKPWTRMNIENANGSKGYGSRRSVVIGVGNLRTRSNDAARVLSEGAGGGSTDAVETFAPLRVPIVDGKVDSSIASLSRGVSPTSAGSGSAERCSRVGELGVDLDLLFDFRR